MFRLFQKNGAGREFEIESPAFDTDDFGVSMDNLTATEVWKLCLEWMSVVPATNDDTPRKETFQLFLRNGTSTGLTPMPIHGSDLALRSMLRKNLRLIIFVSAPKLVALVKNKAFKALNSLSPIAQLAHELAKRSSGDSSLFSSDPSAASSASGSSAGGAGDRGGRVGRGGGGGGGPSATAATPGIDDGHKRRGRSSSGANTAAKAARTDGGKDETDNGGDGEGGGDDMKSEGDSSVSGGSDGEDDDDDSEAEFLEELNAEKGGDGDRGDLYDQEDLSPENMQLLEDEGDVFMEVDSRGDGLSASIRELLLDNYQLTPAMVRVCFNVPFAPDHHRRIATLYRLAESARFDSVFQNELEGGGDAVATMSHECFAQHGLWEKMLKARKVLGRLPEETPELSVPNARFNWYATSARGERARAAGGGGERAMLASAAANESVTPHERGVALLPPRGCAGGVRVLTKSADETQRSIRLRAGVGYARSSCPCRLSALRRRCGLT